MSPSTDALTAALVFRRPESSRNRNFALHASREGAAARRRAARVRGVVRQIAGAFGPAREVLVVADDGDEIRLRYTLARVSLTREARMSPIDLSMVRVALLHAGTRLLPAALIAREDDRARIEALLGEYSRAVH